MKVLDVPQCGKLGLTVTWPGRNGLIRRAYAIPSNPRTFDQLTVRNRLQTVTAGWRALTDAQQDAWTALAAQHQTKSVLGQSGPLTGIQLYTKINCSLLVIGAAPVAAPPAYPSFQLLPISGFTITNAANVITLNLTTTDSPPDGTMLWGCAPQSPGTRRPVSWRYLTTLDSPVNNKINITTAYVNEFGEPAVDDRVFVKCNQNINGWQDVPLLFNSRVPAAT